MNEAAYFFKSQADWIRDESGLLICEKGRQLGFSYAHSYKITRRAAKAKARDEWVMSRDEIQAKQFILYCKRWAKVLSYAATDHGEQVLTTEDGKAIKVQVLTFASGASIYALSSNPDAIVGKTGHVTLDEFALHKAQRELYSVAKPVTQWGGTLAIISTHRGVGTVFNQILRDIRERANPMGWSLHSVPVQKAVAEGLVEKINAASGRNETREAWLARQRAECLDEEQWQQEYCCIPADESSAFLSYDLITLAEDDSAPRDWSYLETCVNPLFVGWDIARSADLSVIDVEEKVGDVFVERMRIEMKGVTFAEQRATLYRLLDLPAVRRACIDATGLGAQLAEEAAERYGYRAEGVVFTNQVKSDLAYRLRAAYEDRRIRHARNAALQADLRGIKKEITPSGNERFVGESADSHCDRFWAKGLAIHAGQPSKLQCGSALI
jgi:phage FluMu gp28-like protein